MPQHPTCRAMRVRNVHDAQVILHAVSQNRLPMVRRRLDDDDRLALQPGHIYVWEERNSNPLESNSLESIQRFTDGRAWGPSKARDDFLLYYEKEGTSRASIIQRNHGLDRSMHLVKQTYSAYVDGPKHSRKWHLNAYYSQATFDRLLTIDDIPELRTVAVPAGQYTCARANNLKRARANNRHSSTDDTDGNDPTTPPLRANTATYGTTPNHHRSPSSPYSGEVHLTPPPAAATTSSSSHRQLAPLQYLENITPRIRNPVDDAQLRALRHSISAL